jgi:hypothetical protein
MTFAEELARPGDLGVLGHGGSLLAQEETAEWTGGREEAGV